MSKTKTLLKLHCTLWAHAFTGNIQMIISSVAITIFAVMGCVGLAFTSYGALVSDGSPAMFVLTMGLGRCSTWRYQPSFPARNVC